MAKPPEALDPSIWHPELLAAPLRNKRLTVLYGPPGALRDGMVRRGLMPLLRQGGSTGRARTRRVQVPIRFDGWGPLPLQALRTRIDAEFRAVWPQGAPDTLAAHLRAIGRQHHATVLLVLDAFERHLGERAERHDIERFDIELAECITHDAVPLHVLMVVDELENRALQRYTRWIAHFGDDFLRLPSLVSSGEGSAWRDTDIEPPPDGTADATPAEEPESDWSVDLLIEPGALADGPAPAPGPVSAPRHAAAPEAAPTLPPLPKAPSPAPAVPAPPVPPRATRTDTAADDEPVRAAPFSISALQALRDDDTPPEPTDAPARGSAGADTRGRPGASGRIEPVFSAAPSEPPAPAPPPARPPAAQAGADATEPAFGPRSAPDAATPPRSVPPWLSEAEVEQMRRLHEPTSRWPGLLGLALYMVVLLAGAWWVARWIIDSQRIETRPGAADSVPAAQPQAAAPATTPAPAPAPPGAAPATARGLALALPADAGSAGPMVDELIRRVAAPAGVELRAAGVNEAAALALMRTDALLAARAANAPPLQVVAPLYTEQIQVLVRTDARWDYVREIRGLRLNIGRADGARARTARALYQQLFGTALPAAQANELELDAALTALQQRGSPVDAVIVVSDVPIEAQMLPAARRQVRELTIDARHMSALTSLPAFSISRRTAQDRARLATTTYLVAPGAPPRPHDAALRRLAAALCQAQPALQSQGSPLLGGLRQGAQPDVGWTYVLPRAPNAPCPQP